MNTELPLAQMTVAEKLRAMEALWADLSERAADDAVPEWHAQVLAEREGRLAAGEERVLDWVEAKRQLRRELHERQDP